MCSHVHILQALFPYECQIFQLILDDSASKRRFPSSSMKCCITHMLPSWHFQHPSVHRHDAICVLLISEENVQHALPGLHDIIWDFISKFLLDIRTN